MTFSPVECNDLIYLLNKYNTESMTKDELRYMQHLLLLANNQVTGAIQRREQYKENS